MPDGMTIIEMASAIGVKPITLATLMRKAGGIKKLGVRRSLNSGKPSDLYDPVAFLSYYAQMTKKGNTRLKALAWLSAHDGGKNQDAPADAESSTDSDVPEPSAEVVTSEAVVVSTPSDLTTGESDFEGCLRQFRDAVNETSVQYRDAVAKGDSVLAMSCLRVWGQAFDQLRKAEQGIFEIQKEQGTLISRASAEEAVARLCVGIRGKLLMLPSKISHELVGRKSASDVQRILDEEIREILNGLSEHPLD